MTTVKAQLNGLRIAPRKVRLVADLLRRKRVQIALDQLAFMVKRSSASIAKAINSAVANAEQNLKLDRDHLWIKDIWVDEGVTLRRWRPKGFGRANPIQKKTSRINVVLEHRASVPKTEEQKPSAPEPAAEGTNMDNS